MKEFTLVTYNAGGLSKARPAAMKFLARNLLRAGSDVICLQEVAAEPDLLQHFNEEFLGGEYIHQAQPPGNDPRGMNLAILSRHPLLQVVSHAQSLFELIDGSRQSRFSRDLLRVDVSLMGQLWSIYTTHLKSMRGGAVAHRQRQSEAAAIVDIIQAEMAPLGERRWLLTGDLNDGRDSATVLRLHGGPLDLRNSLEERPAKRVLTFPCQGPRHQFDYILLPGFMAPGLTHSKVWPESRASDHCMVSARFAVLPDAGYQR